MLKLEVTPLNSEEFKITTTTETFPTFGPLSLIESEELETRKAVQNLSSSVPIFLTNIVTLLFEKYDSMHIISKETGLKLGSLNARLKSRTKFRHNGETFILLYEEELTKDEIMLGSISQERVDEILVNHHQKQNQERQIIPPQKAQTSTRKSHCVVSLFGDIIHEFRTLADATEFTGISVSGHERRLRCANIYKILDQDCISVYKHEISEEDLFLKKISIEQVNSIIYRGKQHSEYTNLKTREKKGWNMVKTRADKIALAENYREQHKDTKDFKQAESRIVKRVVIACKITEKFQDETLVEKITELTRTLELAD